MPLAALSSQKGKMDLDGGASPWHLGNSCLVMRMMKRAHEKRIKTAVPSCHGSAP